MGMLLHDYIQESILDGDSFIKPYFFFKNRGEKLTWQKLWLYEIVNIYDENKYGEIPDILKLSIKREFLNYQNQEWEVDEDGEVAKFSHEDDLSWNDADRWIDEIVKSKKIREKEIKKVVSSSLDFLEEEVNE